MTHKRACESGGCVGVMNIDQTKTWLRIESEQSGVTY